ncbi:MAG: BlaI/MecI/CopY family transcriptional regulator [Gemmatimonadota bacterium]
MGSEGGARPLDELFSKRERQVMDVVHRRGEATAAEVYEELPDAPSYNAVRGVLRLLEEKGHLVHGREGRRFVYRAAVPAERAGRAAVAHLVRTFFGGSTAELVSTLLDARPPSDAELDRLQRLIDEARGEAGS